MAKSAASPRLAKRDITVMSVRELTWLRFKRNRLAVGAGILLIVFYVVAAFAG